MADMLTRRLHHTVVTLSGRLYVLGGDSDDGALASVEQFDPETNTWKSVAPMHEGRVELAAAVLDGKIYVVEDDSERYDPTTDTWEYFPDPPSEHFSDPTAVAMDGKLWMTGGYHPSDMGYVQHPSVDVFDPKTNTWTTKADMTDGRNGHALVVLDGELHAVGGSSGIDEYGSRDKRTVEKFDARLDCWIAVPEMDLPEGLLSSAGGVDAQKPIFGGAWAALMT